MIVRRRHHRLAEDSTTSQSLHLELRQRVDKLLASRSIPLRVALEWAGDEYHTTIGANLRELTAGQLARWAKQIQQGQLDQLSTRPRLRYGAMGKGEGENMSLDGVQDTQREQVDHYKPARPRLQPWITGKWGH